MSRVRVSRQAETDIHGIWDYIGIEKAAPVAAERLIEGLRGKFKLLAKHPMMGKARDDLREGLRIFSVGSYVVLYYPAEDGIEVAGVIHAARDIEGIFRRGER